MADTIAVIKTAAPAIFQLAETTLLDVAIRSARLIRRLVAVRPHHSHDLTVAAA
jgi:hypothetical protein